MSRENKEHIPWVKISEKEKKRDRINFKAFLKRHNEPDFFKSRKKG